MEGNSFRYSWEDILCLYKESRIPVELKVICYGKRAMDQINLGTSWPKL